MMNKKKRYVMVKKKYLEEGGIYHVIQRAPGNELLFKTNKDKSVFLRMMDEILPKYKINLFAYSLMPNHLHMLVQIKSINLSIAMKKLFEKYAFYFNKSHRRKGHVFYGVYRTIQCDTAFSILVVSCYIHLNAFKAKLVSNSLDYQWHSLENYISNKSNNIVEASKILKFIDSDSKKASKIYLKLINKLSSAPYKKVVNNRFAVQTFFESCSKKIKVHDFLE